MKKNLLLFVAFSTLITWTTIAQSCLPGGITFSTQAEIDAFPTNYPGCTEILGDVYISGSDITNLNGLSGVISIGGRLQIVGNASLMNFTGLEALTSIGLTLQISNNDFLSSLTGLDAVISIGGHLNINDNTSLMSLTALSAVTSVVDLEILGNPSLMSLTGLDALTSINGNLLIYNNATLTSLTALSAVTSVGHALNIYNNEALMSLSGLDGITSVGGAVGISNNDALLSLSGLGGITSILSIAINNNDALTSLTGLDGLTTIGGELSIQINPALTSLTGLEALTSIVGNLTIQFNNSLTSLLALSEVTSVGGLDVGLNAALMSLSGLDGLTSIGGFLQIFSNATLMSLTALSGVTSIVGHLYIANNTALTSLTGLDNIDHTTITNLYIQNSNNLSLCEVQSICDYLANPLNPATISGNAIGCATREEVEAACPNCFDNIQNGDETGIDCGGSFCEPCVVCDEYIIISEENMEIEKTIIHSGGIGVLNEDEFAEINDHSKVIAAGTFVKAPDVDVNDGSQVTTIIEEQADPCMPVFLYNTNPSNNDVTVDEDETVTLNLAIYDDIEVEDGATVIFSGHQDVYIDDFEAHENVTIIFSQCTNLCVKKEFRLGSQTDFNTANENVAVFSEDKIALEGRNIAKGLFYTLEEVIIHKAKSSDRNKLYGQYIGREVDVAAYTDMYFQLYVPCNQPLPFMAPEEENIEALEEVLTPNGQTNGFNPGETKRLSNISALNVAPNPFTAETNIRFKLDQEDYVIIGIYNLNGQLVNQLVSGIMPSGSHKLNWKGSTSEGNLLQNGIYLVILKTNEQLITEKVSLVR